MNHNIWHLHNNRIEKSLGNLTIEQAIDHIRNENQSELAYWYAWTEQLGQWTPVLSVTEIASALKPKAAAKIMPPPPPPPPHATKPKTINLDSDDSINIVEFVPDATHTSTESHDNRRQHKRFDLRLRVIVRSDDLTFRSFSTNISLGGFAVETVLPSGLIGKDCHIYFSDPKSNHNVRFHAKLIPNRKDARYFIFTEVSQEDTEKLSNWFKRYGFSVKQAS